MLTVNFDIYQEQWQLQTEVMDLTLSTPVLVYKYHLYYHHFSME